MQYRTMPTTGEQLSILGFGCMRLPEQRGRIDEPRATRLIHDAIDAGINYFDTAFPYHQGHSESCLGRALKGSRRERVKIATKLPHWLVKTAGDMSKILALQLEKLQTDHIDYYMVHNVTEARWQQLREIGVVEFLENAQREGRIQHVGFSFHGGRDEFKRMVDDYDWQFCQIQYNYLDEKSQAGREGLEYAAAKGLGIVVMEPLRGGNLAKRPVAKIEQIWRRAETERTPAEWALRWLWNHPDVHVVLSGMTEESDLTENVRIAEQASANSLTPEELALVEEVAAAFRSMMRAGCTGCQYCMPCPAGVNIPHCLQLLDSYHLFGNKQQARLFYLLGVSGLIDGKRGLASQCIDCGKCEDKCPQHLPIPRLLKESKRTFESFSGRMTLRLFKILLPLIRWRTLR